MATYFTDQVILEKFKKFINYPIDETDKILTKYIEIDDGIEDNLCEFDKMNHTIYFNPDKIVWIVHTINSQKYTIKHTLVYNKETQQFNGKINCFTGRPIAINAVYCDQVLDYIIKERDVNIFWDDVQMI